MNQANIADLLDRYLKKETTVEENHLVELWLAENGNADPAWQKLDRLNKDQWLSGAFSEIKDTININKSKVVVMKPQKYLWYKIAGVAAVLVISLSFYLNWPLFGESIFSLNSLAGEYEMDQTRSNIFNNNQDVLAVYNSYNYRDDNWQFKAGVRAEETIINGNYNLGSHKLKQRYLNVVPAIVANRKFKDRSSVSLSFAKRIQRPAIAQLNPFVDRANPDFQVTGNPDLRPITSNAFQISYLKSTKATLSIVLGYLYFNRVINAFSSYDPATNVTLTRYENYGKGRVFKTNIYINYPITDNWNINLNSDLRQVTFYGIVDNITLKNSGFDVYVYASSGYSFKKGWRASADFTYKKAGILLPLGRTNGFTASSFSVNKDVVQNKLTLSAAVSNPFTKYRYINEQLNGPDFLQITSNQSYYQRFTVSLNYRFGKLKEEIKRNKRSIKNDDLSTN